MTKIKSHKVIIVGDKDVGKTTLEECCLGQVKHSQPTGIPELQYTHKEIKDCDMGVWSIRDDKSDCFKTNIRLFKNAHVIILVFDVTRRKTFENVDKWIEMIIEHDNYQLLPPTIIVGNKIDKRPFEKLEMVVQKEEGLEKTKQLKMKYETPVTYIETSSKNKKHTNALPELLYEMAKQWEINEKYQNITFDPSTAALAKHT